MGSSIRSYLRLCCGVFHQIPTLAGVLTSSGEGYKGSEGMMLCLHLSCLFLFSASLPVYLLGVIAHRHGNACLLTVCVHVMLLHMPALTRASVLLSASPAAAAPSPSTAHTHAHACVYPVTLCVCVWLLKTLWPRQRGVACWHWAVAGELPSLQLIESKQANQSQQCSHSVGRTEQRGRRPSRCRGGTVQSRVCVSRRRGEHADVPPTTSCKCG